MAKMIEEKLLSFLKTKLPQILPGSRILRLRVADSRKGYDLSFMLEIGGLRKQIICVNVTSGEPRYIYQVIGRLDQVKKDQKKASYPLIIAQYISEYGKKICQEAGIGFMDTFGNVYLKFDTIFIEKEAKEKSKQKREPTARTIFYPKASRILRVLLENPKKNWTLQMLSDEAVVYIRQTWVVVNVLSEKGFIEKKRGSIILIEPGGLLDYWAQNYNFGLNRLDTYFSFARSFDEFLKKIKESISEKKLICALTRHSGAAMVAPYVRFSNIHLYIQGDMKIWQKNLELKPVERGGTIYLLRPYDEGIFYHLQKIKGIPVVSNIQLYIDLITYPARGEEQADFLRKKKIRF